MEEFLNIDFSNQDINKDLKTISISKTLDYIKKEFDKVGVATKTHDKHFNNPESIYYQKTVDEIINIWEAKGAESRKYGSMLDDYIGCCLTGNKNDLEIFKLDNSYDYDERLKSICISFDNFYKFLMKSGDVIFVTREQTLYYKVKIKNPLYDYDNNESEYLEYYIKGRFDALFYNKRLKKWIVIDWKSNDEIKKSNIYQKMLGPCFQLDDCDYIRYTLQTHFYKKALLNKYLPEGTKEEDVIVLVVDMPGHIVKGLDTDYEILQEAFKYNSKLLDEIFNFAYRKDILINK